MQRYLGWPLALAREDMARRGIACPPVYETAAPRAESAGTQRIVAVRADALIAARFSDAPPTKEKSE